MQVEDEVVKAPGEVTLTVYCTCPDITRTVTPDLKHGDSETGRYMLLHSLVLSQILSQVKVYEI